MKANVCFRQAIVGWIFFIFFAALLYLFDNKTYGNLYTMFVTKDILGLFILVLAGLPIGYLISQISWFTFSMWPVSFKFPWAVVDDFKKPKADGIAEDSQSDHLYFKDADERMANFNSRMTEFYSLHMDAVTAIITAFVAIYFRIFQVGIKLDKLFRIAGTSRLIMLFAVISAVSIIILVFNARSCRRDLIDQKRLWNRDKLEDKAKYIHINPVLVLLPIIMMVIMFFLKAVVLWQIIFLVLLYEILSLFSLYKVSL